MKTVEERFVKLLHGIELEQRFDEAGWDSLDKVKFLVEVEEEFCLDLPEEDSQFGCPQDVLDCLLDICREGGDGDVW